MAAQTMKRVNLLRYSWIRWMLANRWPQFIVQSLLLSGFILAIIAGIAGTPVGNRNLAIVFIWIAWWALLVLILVPLLGRFWCSICPIPLPGEWLQRGAIISPPAPDHGERPKRAWRLNLRWPRKFRNIWLQNIAFALLALFSVVVLTDPKVTAFVLIFILLTAILTSLVYERRAFCRYLCPVGGFIGLYSQTSPVEIRVVDPGICKSHQVKTCFTGNTDGYGCPWQVFPASLSKNSYCGMCMECLRTCPHENIALNLRSFGEDLANPSGRKLDEGFKAFIMLGSALAYSAVLLGPWGWLKSAAYSIPSIPWLLYILLFIVLIFGILPGSFLLSAIIGKKLSSTPSSTIRLFKDFSYTLIPLGLSAWFAFSLSFVFVNISYVWPILSDPMGWGWNLVGTANHSWSPYLMDWLQSLQAIVLVTGLCWSTSTAMRISQVNNTGIKGAQLALPFVAFCLLTTLILLGLLIR
jgi:polyferredoxin